MIAVASPAPTMMRDVDPSDAAAPGPPRRARLAVDRSDVDAQSDPSLMQLPTA
jgi:hypothetical protein